MAGQDIMIWTPNLREQEWLDNHDVIRSYEVSIWTLQDDFITVLKYANLENKGQLKDGKLKLNVDGTQELTFTIPMYLYNPINNRLEENPMWYNTQNGNIAISMRKIKLIFNKEQEHERVFEFLITKVEERHTGDELYCDVTCEGLAFHELGKVGYKISVESDDFYNDDYNWFKDRKWTDKKGVEHTTQPLANLQYWLNLFLNDTYTSPREWYYEIQMNYSAFPDAAERESNKVYEEAYPSSWKVEDNKLTVATVEPAQEKARLVDLVESNIYNLTQDLAEAFGVFCKYEYEYDKNYHIIGRKIIFYNNFLYEEKGYIDFTYPYKTSEINRNMDSTDLITKMFVRTVDDDSTASGQLTIIDTNANKSGEDYLLNFDYLHKIKAISEEQYAAVTEYETKMKDINMQLVPLDSQIISLSSQLPDLEAKLTIATNAIQLDTERIGAASDLFNELTENDGEIEVTAENPATAVLLEDSSAGNGSFYINLSKRGIDASSIHIYRNFDVTKSIDNGRLYDELKTGYLEYNEFGDITKVHNLYPSSQLGDVRRMVFLTYNYTPKLYYERVINTWTQRLAKDSADQNAYTAKINSIKQDLEYAKTTYNDLIIQKNAEIKKFEALMGPALREGYWAPDDYKDCGDKYTHTFTLSDNSNGIDDRESSGVLDSFIWDTELFQDEFSGKQEIGIPQTEKYYPCIDLTNFFNTLYSSGLYADEIKQRITTLSFFFCDYNGIQAYQLNRPLDAGRMRAFGVNSQCHYGFIKKQSDGPVIPVLILDGFETIPTSITINKVTKDGNNEPVITPWVSDMVSFVKSRQMYLGKLSAGSNLDEALSFEWSWKVSIENDEWIDGPYEMVYPRIQIDSLAVKTSSDQLFVRYNGIELKNVEDYYCLSKIPAKANEAYYYITIKPDSMFKYGGNVSGKSIDIRYVISNADTAIFLDAQKVLKENSIPKVSYTIKLNTLNREFMRNAYDRLCYVAHINDPELKFENVMGYISQINLKLDEPWNDDIEIINYKTKFEDLFSTILATTEDIKKSNYIIQAVGSNFDAYGSIKPWSLENTIYKVDLDFAFNQGKLTIDDENGIWGVSSSGVVAIRGGGIFTSTEQDDSGNWKWNTGITPEGINATLITAGQLDTNRVMIYAGDKLRFQLNGEGLFAYKSLFEDIATINEWVRAELTESQTVYVNQFNNKINSGYNGDLDVAQYVCMDQNGLHLVAKPDALILNSDRTNYVQVGKTLFKWYSSSGGSAYQISIPEEGVKRVSISWEGLKLKNYYNQDVFYADADNGNLSIKGTIYASELNLGGRGVGSSITLNEYFGEPNNLILGGLTESVIKGIFVNSVTHIFYMTEKELAAYLTNETATAGDIWFNTNAISDDYTIFIIRKADESSGIVYNDWYMDQIEASYNGNYILTKALLGIYQANLDGKKYATVYKGVAINTTTNKVVYGNYSSSISLTITDDGLTAQVTDTEGEDDTELVDLPLEDQNLNSTTIHVNENNFSYGDIWINTISDNEFALYRWESDYVNEDGSSGNWVLITPTTTLTSKDTIYSKVNTARSEIQRIINGETGLLFTHTDTDSNVIKDIELNKKVGLKIKSREGAYFRVNSSEFGFIDPYGKPYLYYSDGNLYVMGTIFAKSFYVYDKGMELTNDTKSGSPITVNIGPNTQNTNSKEITPMNFNEYLSYDFKYKELESTAFNDKMADMFNIASSIINDITDVNSAFNNLTQTNKSIFGQFHTAIQEHLYDKKDDIYIEDGGIIIAAKKDIKIGTYNSDANTLNGIQLSNDGIWLGSSKEIVFHSNNSLSSISSTSYATMRISPTQILFGVTTGASQAITQIDKDKILMGVTAAANTLPSSAQVEISYNSDNNTISATNIVSGIRIMKDSLGLVTANTNTNNIILLDSTGIGIVSKQNDNYSGIIIRPTDLIMTTVGKVQLMGTSGKIQFGSDGNIAFRVDEKGNVYCKSITCEDSNIAVNNVTGQTNVPSGNVNNKVTWSTNTVYFSSGSTNGMNLGPASGSVAAGYYTLEVKLGKGEEQSAYFSSLKIMLNGKTVHSGSYAYNRNLSNPILTCSDIYLSEGSPVLSIQGTVDQGMSIKLSASATLYPSFKTSSSTVTGSWSGSTYTVTNQAGNTTLSQVNITGNWDNKTYKVKSGDTEITSTTITGNWNNKTYKVKSGSTELTSTTITGDWNNSTTLTLGGTNYKSNSYTIKHQETESGSTITTSLSSTAIYGYQEGTKYYVKVNNNDNNNTNTLLFESDVAATAQIESYEYRLNDLTSSAGTTINPGSSTTVTAKMQRKAAGESSWSDYSTKTINITANANSSSNQDYTTLVNNLQTFYTKLQDSNTASLVISYSNTTNEAMLATRDSSNNYTSLVNLGFILDNPQAIARNFSS